MAWRDTDRLIDWLIDELEHAFDAPLEQVFSSFEHNPIASGAVAQVHRAVLHDGRVVAVKVRHPHAVRIMKLDMALLRIAVNRV
jgi:predicted unusual protein kinase regulating ubiquinone biosynthesis (AarF/ABC1/UbiB family)